MDFDLNGLDDYDLSGFDEYDREQYKSLWSTDTPDVCYTPRFHIQELVDKYEEEGKIYCNSSWNTVSCWPTTLAGEIATLPCPKYFGDAVYDSSFNATRRCLENGTWLPKADYSNCPITHKNVNSIHTYITRIIYDVGFTASVVALIIALFIFLYFRNLRCPRNTIHCHLIVTFILRNIVWVVMNNGLQKLDRKDENEVHSWICKIVVAIYNYLQVTNFFWMLVEGLYLHLMIVWAFSIEKIPFWTYVLLGWGTPAVVIIVWCLVKYHYENVECWFPRQDTYYDYAYIVPILIVLAVNLLFLSSILYVLVTKLTASNALQTGHYRKAVKATLILMPLLGLTYILMLTPPGDDPVATHIFVYFNAVLQSIQGLAIAVFYCFLNGEVQATIKQRFSRWQEGRNVTTRYTRASICTNGENVNLNSRGSVLSTQSNGRPARHLRASAGENGVSQVVAPMLQDEMV